MAVTNRCPETQTSMCLSSSLSKVGYLSSLMKGLLRPVVSVRIPGLTAPLASINSPSTSLRDRGQRDKDTKKMGMNMKLWQLPLFGSFSGIRSKECQFVEVVKSGSVRVDICPLFGWVCVSAVHIRADELHGIYRLSKGSIWLEILS